MRQTAIYQTRKHLQIVNDQHGCPTSSRVIADITARAIKLLQQRKGEEGLFHLAPIGNVTWFDFAKVIIQIIKEEGLQLTLNDKNITPITSDDYHTLARRPSNSLMDSTKIRETFDLDLPFWREPLRDIIRRIGQQ